MQFANRIIFDELPEILDGNIGIYDADGVSMNHVAILDQLSVESGSSTRVTLFQQASNADCLFVAKPLICPSVWAGQARAGSGA